MDTVKKKCIPENVRSKYLEIAEKIGCDTAKLIWVNHDRNDNPYLEKK